ncbi:MAG: helix-turn-helix transcriptional regulator [Litorimonas sp.]
MSEEETKWIMIGERLKTAREFLELSQDEVAAALGLKRPAISKIENGKRKVDAVELSRFSEIYDQSIEALSGKATDMPLPQNVKALARAATDLSDGDREKLLDFAKYLQSKPVQ